MTASGAKRQPQAEQSGRGGLGLSHSHTLTLSHPLDPLDPLVVGMEGGSGQDGLRLASILSILAPVCACAHYWPRGSEVVVVFGCLAGCVSLDVVCMQSAFLLMDAGACCGSES